MISMAAHRHDVFARQFIQGKRINAGFDGKHRFELDGGHQGAGPPRRTLSVIEDQPSN